LKDLEIIVLRHPGVYRLLAVGVARIDDVRGWLVTARVAAAGAGRLHPDLTSQRHLAQGFARACAAGRIVAVISRAIRDGRVVHIHGIGNPAKLRQPT
jgi:hypothetical protein